MTEHGTYAFVYDEALNERRYERQVAALETKLTTLGVVGRTIRLAMFRSAKDTVESLVNQGVTTIVVVGNDRTLDKVMWFLPDLNVTLGYIPLFGPSDVAGPLGIPFGVDACDVLAARIVETVDVGLCEDRYFLTEAKVPNTIATVHLEDRLTLTPVNGGTIIIRNLDVRNAGKEIRNDAKDGLLEVIVKPKDVGNSGWLSRKQAAVTKMFMRYGELVSLDPVDLQIDGHVTNGFRFRFSVLPHKLRIIAGKNRRLSPKDDVLPIRTESSILAAATNDRHR